MRHTIISGRQDAHRAIAVAVWIVAVFWIVAGIVAVIVLGGGLTRLAVALAVVSTEWWLIPQIEHRLERNDAKMGPVTHLRPASIDRRDLKTASPHASWRDASAA
jgi:hypothetical protein